MPALEALRGDYTEIWCAGQNVPLARFADCARSIASTGLDRLGIVEADDVIDRLRGFDSIVSWYGTNRPDFRELMRDLRLPIQFFPALPDGTCHAVDFYNRQTGVPGASRFPRIACPPAAREFAVVNPFASSLAKRASMEIFERIAERLSRTMPVHWLCGPEQAGDELPGAVRIDDLHELACWLRRARVFVGNDSGISHLAAAVGTPVLVLFQTTDPQVWAPRGPSAHAVNTAPNRRITCGE